MRDLTVIRERYLRDDLPVRLGGLAANLARMKSFSSLPQARDAVEGLIDESKHFIEWAAPDAQLEAQAELVALQLQLAMWHADLDTLWNDPGKRQAFSSAADQWSQRVLELSGLLG